MRKARQGKAKQGREAGELADEWAGGDGMSDAGVYCLGRSGGATSSGRVGSRRSEGSSRWAQPHPRPILFADSTIVIFSGIMFISSGIRVSLSGSRRSMLSGFRLWRVHRPTRAHDRGRRLRKLCRPLRYLFVTFGFFSRLTDRAVTSALTHWDEARKARGHVNLAFGMHFCGSVASTEAHRGT